MDAEQFIALCNNLGVAFSRHTGKRISILSAVKANGEAYIFLFNDEGRESCAEKLVQFAENPDLSFNWDDTAHLGRELANVQNKIMYLYDRFSCLRRITR